MSYRGRGLVAILGLLGLLALPALAIASPRVKVPTDLRVGPQVKPYVITTTGDGSGFFGGYMLSEA